MVLFTGPEMLLRKASSIDGNSVNRYFDADGNGDVVEAHEWKCVRTVNGMVYFQYGLLFLFFDYFMLS